MYELIERYGYRKMLIGRYSTRQQAEQERRIRQQLYRTMRVDHGTLTIREAF